MTPSVFEATAAIAAIALATYATRAAGLLLVSFAKIGRRLETALRAGALGVLAALVALGVASDGARGAGAIGAAMLVAVLTKRPALALIAGVAVAATWRFL